MDRLVYVSCGKTRDVFRGCDDQCRGDRDAMDYHHRWRLVREDEREVRPLLPLRLGERKGRG